MIRKRKSMRKEKKGKNKFFKIGLLSILILGCIFFGIYKVASIKNSPVCFLRNYIQFLSAIEEPLESERLQSVFTAKKSAFPEKNTEYERIVNEYIGLFNHARTRLERYGRSNNTKIKDIYTPIDAALNKLVSCLKESEDVLKKGETTRFLSLQRACKESFNLFNETLKSSSVKTIVLISEKEFYTDSKGVGFYKCTLRKSQCKRILSDIEYYFGDELKKLNEGVLKGKTFGRIIEIDLPSYIRPILYLRKYLTRACAEK